ncbi:lamin tail domain-containing protein [Candidatus Woesebacteria bacterium]|nr:lamin tail domain-containing protein [Candidatus Woesebacteria bacterium]
MEQRTLSRIVIVLLAIFTLLVFLSFNPVRKTLSAASHIVISEVQISGDGANPSDDEFVELYNPTDSDVVMSGWKLTRKNSSGTSANLVSNLNGTIPAHRYFLIVDGNGYNGSVTVDTTYSAPSNALTNNYTVLLFDDTSTLVDKVGFGTATDPENTVFSTNPSANSSIERKANSSSDESSMVSGIDQFAGNGEDTNNNANDFVLRTTPDPQNSSSSPEPEIVPTPTPTPTEEPTPTEIPPTLTPSPTLTPTPTETPTPTQTPTPTLEPTSTPTPTNQPTQTPTPTVTPTITPTSTPSPTPTSSPKPTPHIIFESPRWMCFLTQRQITFFGVTFTFPRIVCERK